MRRPPTADIDRFLVVLFAFAFAFLFRTADVVLVFFLFVTTFLLLAFFLFAFFLFAFLLLAFFSFFLATFVTFFAFLVLGQVDASALGDAVRESCEAAGLVDIFSDFFATILDSFEGNLASLFDVFHCAATGVEGSEALRFGAAESLNESGLRGGGSFGGMGGFGSLGLGGRFACVV